jgi:hypothetical protein
MSEQLRRGVNRYDALGGQIAEELAAAGNFRDIGAPGQLP